MVSPFAGALARPHRVNPYDKHFFSKSNPPARFPQHILKFEYFNKILLFF